MVYKAIGPNHFLLISLLGQICPFLVEETRLKPGVIWTTQGNVHTLAELKQVLSAEIKVADSQLSNQTNQISQPNIDLPHQPNLQTKPTKFPNQTLTYQTDQICKPNIDQPNFPTKH